MAGRAADFMKSSNRPAAKEQPTERRTGKGHRQLLTHFAEFTVLLAQHTTSDINIMQSQQMIIDLGIEVSL